MSRRVTFFRAMKLDIVLRHLSTLSLGKRVSNETESNSIPANESVVEGPSVSYGAMGTPR